MFIIIFIIIIIIVVVVIIISVLDLQWCSQVSSLRFLLWSDEVALIIVLAALRSSI